MRKLLTLGMTLCLIGCASVVARTLRDQASFDLRCPPEGIEVTLGSDQRSGEVLACGNRVRYRDVGETTASWVRLDPPPPAK